MPSTPMTAPISAGRTGTAVLPRPVSSAKRVPTMTGTPTPARATVVATAERRFDAPRRAALSARAAAASAPPVTAAMMTAMPGPITTQSKEKPGDGSRNAAVPIGIQFDAT